MNPAALAFMGDAVYEQRVREKILADGRRRSDIIHRTSTRYVSATSQAKAIRGIFDELSEEEKSLVQRARNYRYTTKAKNADAMTYKWASAFEALIGHLFLLGDEERLDQVIRMAFDVIEDNEL